MLGRIRGIGAYAPSGLYTDAEPVENEQIEQPAGYYNRHLLDTAIHSRTMTSWVVTFALDATAAPYTILAANISVRGPGGTDASMKPTISKTAPGAYSLLFPTSYTDDIGEEVLTTFMGALPALITSTDGKVQVSDLGSAVVALIVRDSAGAASDMAGRVTLVLW